MSAKLTRLLSCGALVLTALALTAPSAFARGHEFSRSFGAPGTGNGELKEPFGVAVNEASDVVYVADKGNDRVEYFNGATGAYLGQFNGSGLLAGEGKAAGSDKREGEEETGAFAEVVGVAVDNSCHARNLTGTACSSADPSNGDVYVIDGGNRVIDKYTAAGEYVSQISAVKISAATVGEEFFLAIHGVAVDRDGQLWVAEEHATSKGGQQKVIDRFDDGVGDPGKLVNQFLDARSTESTHGPQVSGGFAVDESGDLYLEIFMGRPLVVELDESGRVLNGVVDAAPGAGLAVEGDDVYVGESGAVARFAADGSLVERVAVAGGAGSGLAVDAATQTVFETDSSEGVHALTPEAPGEPSVEAGSTGVSEVSGDSADVTAMVDPRSEPDEEPTKYRVEFGVCATPSSCASSPFGQKIEGTLAPNYEPDRVTAHLQGLQSGSTYHVKVVAENEHPGVAEGEVVVFRTQSAASFGLLDGRGWELVSPPDKHGAGLLGLRETGVTQASVSGDALTYLATAPTESSPAGVSNEVQVLSTRGEGGGWASSDLSLPHPVATGVPVGTGQEYRAFSGDLSAALVQPLGAFEPSLSSAASEQGPYLRTLKGSCSASLSCFTPLVTGCPAEGEPCARAVEEHADVPAGTEIDAGEKCPAPVVCGPEVVDASPDLAHAVISSFASGVSLVPGQAPGGGLYEWSNGSLALVSVLPGPGGAPVPASSDPVVGYEGKNLRDAVSSDGSRVVWSEKDGGHHLYVTDVGLGVSVRVDTPVKGVVPGGKVEPVFQFASSDGSRVFFTDTQRLTTNAGSEGEGKKNEPDLYECDVVVEEGELECHLSDLTPITSGGESADVQGLVAGGSSDGGTVYFVADAVLASGRDSGGEEPVKGGCVGKASAAGAECNLYVESAGVTSLVAVLSNDDAPDWGSANKVLSGLTGRVSGDGSWLVFMSDRSLTGYDNRDAVSGVRDEEVFAYHAGSGVVCVSCDPTGGRPHGVKYPATDRLAFGDSVWPTSSWLAGQVPGWTPVELSGSLYQSRYLSGSGRVFFTSSDGLVPKDRNGAEDVYEWEPVGVGNCTTASAGFVEAEGGCVGLVSSGASNEESAFLDASESGDDVFFLTQAQLSSRDVDTALDVYDARVGGGEAEAARPVECSGDACQSAVAPPEDPTPGSLTYQGPGNVLVQGLVPKAKPKAKPQTRAQKLTAALRVCKKVRARSKRAECEAKARKQFGSVKKAKKQGRK